MERIGKYEIRQRLGEGASATVYLGHDPFARRPVAVKLFRPEALQDQERGRVYRHLLVNEASLAGRLNHPHIVQIYDAVVDAAQSYIVMEYVAGGTLEPFSGTDNLLPVDRLVEIVFKCSRALDYAHRLGVTHRDIKPANILLAGEGGDIKISDFGAALLADDDQTRTQVTGVGSPAYMSPEQVQEQALDHRTDIYSLGVVFYRLLTGRLPFQASSHAGMVFQIVNQDAPPPSTFRVDLSPELDAIVARAMARRREERYATWEEFSHDLARSFRGGAGDTAHNLPDSGKFETLRALAFFQGFSDVELWEVLRFSRWEEGAPGAVLMRDGEPGDHFCFLLRGAAAVVKQGREISRLGPGDCFGEMALVGGAGLRGADVVAQGACRVLTIRRDALAHASEACRMHFYQGFLAVLSRRLDAANGRLAARGDD